jgi:hypothetical protein
MNQIFLLLIYFSNLFIAVVIKMYYIFLKILFFQLFQAVICSHVLYFAVSFLGYVCESLLRVQFRHKIIWTDVEMIALALIIYLLKHMKAKRLLTGIPLLVSEGIV